MRRARLICGIAAVVIALAGITTAALRRAESDEPIKQPAITYEQTKAAIIVRLDNPNKTWGLRTQQVHIRLYEQPSNPFNEYGPDGYSSVEGHPEFGRIHCCVITELRPGGHYTFSLLPSERFKVNTLTIDVVGPPGWIKM